MIRLFGAYVALGAYIEIVEQLITVDLFSVSVFITEDLSVEMSNLLVTINSVLLYSALFLLSLLGGLVKKGFLKNASYKIKARDTKSW